VCALADEGSEHLHHSGVLCGRLAGDTLQYPDDADAHVKLFGAKLLHRRGAAGVSRPSRDSATFRAVNASAPAASRPAPSASNRPRAASRAVARHGSLAEPRSWRANQPPAGTINIGAAAGARPAAIPPGVHRMPRWEAPRRFVTGTTLGEHDRLRGPFGDNADAQVPEWTGARCISADAVHRPRNACPTVTRPGTAGKNTG
jgi:hypothetical protein